MVMVRALRDRRQRPPPRPLLAPGRCDEAHAGHALHRSHGVNAAGDRPPARARLLHERKAIEPDPAAKRRRIAAEAAAVELEAEHAQPVSQAEKADETRIPRGFFCPERKKLSQAP